MNTFEDNHERGGDSDSWISISDMMAGLMVIFLFIAITYIRPVQEQQSKIREIAVAFNESELSILNDLRSEFERSRLIKEDEKENRQASRRVEFKIRTNAKQQVVKVLETLE